MGAREARGALPRARAVIPFPFPFERLPRRLKQNMGQIRDGMWDENNHDEDGMEEPYWGPSTGAMSRGYYCFRSILWLSHH